MEQENEVVNEAVAEEKPMDPAGTVAIEPDASVDAQKKLAEETAASTEEEAPQFSERAFVAEESERVQSNSGERVFVAGVGFIEVSHPK